MGSMLGIRLAESLAAFGCTSLNEHYSAKNQKAKIDYS